MASSSQHRGASWSSPSGSQHPQHRTMPQSSPSGSHQPNVSQPSESVGDNTLRSSNGKLPIIAHADGRVTGVYSAKWSSRVGYWIRAIVPISYASWDKVDGSFKDEVWLKLMEQFQLNVNPTMGARKNIEKWFALKFRYWKYALRGKILKNCESEQEAISSCPTGFDLIHWETFAIHENRQEDEANPEKKHRRMDSWKYGHKHRDGTVLERAQEYYDRVTSVEEQMAEEASEHGGEAVYDITCDPLAQVFGKDKGSRTHGLSSCMSNKQLQTFAIAEELVEQESSSKSKLEDELAEQVPNLINRNGSLNPPFWTSYPNVKILGRKGEHVANGYVKTDGQKCHFRDIMGDEKVVYITNVLVGDAPAYMMVPGMIFCIYEI
ncbi:hypothetical protein IFM89_006502 [Coptis chinensis]|uniref:Transposase n=1 Tax=Coptis chinensis TaxID=261450 RepID=A0A835M4X2_9MAGN|nr:hypothetical protein IFM89_006502 [Coptis chinensis]